MGQIKNEAEDSDSSKGNGCSYYDLECRSIIRLDPSTEHRLSLEGRIKVPSRHQIFLFSDGGITQNENITVNGSIVRSEDGYTARVSVSNLGNEEIMLIPGDRIATVVIRSLGDKIPILGLDKRVMVSDNRRGRPKKRVRREAL